MYRQQQRQREQQHQRQQQRAPPGGAACVSRPPAAATGAPATATDGCVWDGRLGGRGVVGGLGGGGLLRSLGGGGGVLGGRRAAEVRRWGCEHEKAGDAADAEAYLGEIGETILVESIRLTMLSLEQAIHAQDKCDTVDTRHRTKARIEPHVHALLERVSMLNSSSSNLLTRV